MILLAVFALAELGLAAFVLLLGSRGESCPLSESGFSCATLLRPRLGALGPLSLVHVAVAGGLASLAFTQLVALRPLTPPLARWGPRVLAVGAGIALGVQTWSATAVGALCPYCLLIALSALGVAVAATAVARLEANAPPLPVLLYGLLSLALAAPLGAWQGSRLAAEDTRRRAAVDDAGGSLGPQLLLVVRPGCPYCEAMLLDTLGDPRVLQRLATTRGVELVGPNDTRLAGLVLAGTPTLVALDSPAAPLEGLNSVTDTLNWLKELSGT